ncbi:MAG: hypothetical protein NZT92_03300 [Abditibacteriales bacterium]|nr:hypothetical protein [Abditibacteriales bacterium]MDW8364912.1 hypothetical protein [Abditibacteriales bacterium]
MRCSPLASNGLRVLSTDFRSGCNGLGHVRYQVIRFIRDRKPLTGMGGCFLWVWLVLLMAVLVHAAPRPDVVVIVFSAPAASDIISVAYRVRADNATVQRDLRVLAQRGGWTVKKLSVTQRDGTGGRLETTGVVNPASSTLPVAPFIETFKRFRQMRLMFVVNSPSSNFMPHQPPVSENRQVRLTFSHRADTYTFDVEILNSKFESITLPTAAVPPPTGAATPPAPARDGWKWWAGVFLLMVMAGSAGGAIWYMCRKPPGKNAA